MQLQDQKRWRYKALSRWKVLGDDRIQVALEDLERFRNRYGILPEKKNVFNMFRMIYPEDVRVVFVGQSPYPGVCPVTSAPYAYGPAFLPAPECVTTPATLRNMMSEMCRDMGGITLPPREILLKWIDQGVMLLNASLTLGTGCPSYLEDHSVLWEEPMYHILTSIADMTDPVFVLVGKDAWKFDVSPRTIKVSHPVARKDTTSPWYGSSVFSQISKQLIEKDEMPIKWRF
jgi:uracil-DNA glycosylase